ncbi:DNA translocase FtsK [Sporosarcina sp. FSL W8-0480]|uniref:DNA translocase FtsK n=1 Tax=Sporosarcina sp. FSL W8-0480 TaxID=2954701 RepID=UPI0030DC557A
MNKIFESEKDESLPDTYTIEDTDDVDDKEENPKERPAFRFPIITDAEIYGWEPDSENERDRNGALITKLDDEEEFTPIPLYKNDRWPGEKEIGKIHRATSSSKYLTDRVIEDDFKRVKPNLSKEESSNTTTIKQKRPFTPTTVPSPVYGYMKPTIRKESTLKTEDEDLALSSSSSKTIDNEEIVKDIQVIDEIDRIETENHAHTSNNEIEVIERFNENVLEVKEEAIELESIDESPTPMDSTESDDSLQVISESNEGELRKKERIVPFNVLMLKNDKLKLEEKREAKESILKNKGTETIPQSQVKESDVGEEMGLPHYAFPPKDFLIQPEAHIEDAEWLQTQSAKLEEALSHFSIQANVIEAVQGPTVTRFELTVGHGTKVSKVRNLTDDLKLALAAEDIRIQAPIPGTSSIGIEIPNRKPRAVRISEVIETERFQGSESPMEAVLGLSLTGEPVTIDLRKMPHGMIAGATGSGKSVCINSILVSLLYKSSPTDLKMLLIDPKMVELAPFNGIPHLISPVITDVKAATAALKWAVGEMERRYELFAHVGARNIERYNEMVEKDRKFSLKLPYLLIVIDELADLMMMAPADVEVSIARITQKARACGIHLIIATQRPSVDVITGTIKANVPTRIAFSVSSQIDSRTIIDTIGAERLLGKGDMLYLGNGQSSAARLQGTFVTDAEIERIIEHVQNEADPEYLFGQEDLLANSMEEEESDPLFVEACQFIISQGSASTSLLQRNFSIGYNRAAKLMDRMEELGFISEQKGSKPRDVFLTENDFEQYLNRTDKSL